MISSLWREHRDRLIECVFYDGLDERIEARLRSLLKELAEKPTPYDVVLDDQN